MKNKKLKVLLIILTSIIIFAGFLLLVLPFLKLSIKGTEFSGIMLILSGSIIMLGLERLENLTGRFFKKLFSAIKDEGRPHLIFLLIIFISGIIFRIIFITKQINYSEAFIYLDYLRERTFNDLFFYSSADNFILNNLFMKPLSLISSDLWVLRLPSLIAGMIIIPASYVTTRILYNKHAALIASAIISSSSYFIYYSTDMRGVSLLLLVFLFTVMTATFLRKNDEMIAWVFISLLSALGFYLTAFYFLPFMTVMIWLILSAIFKDTAYSLWNAIKRVLLVAAVSFMFTFLFYIPVIITSGIRDTVNFNFSKAENLKLALKSLIDLIRPEWIGLNAIINLIFIILLFIAVIFSVTISRKNKKHKISLFYAVAIVITIFMLSLVKFSSAVSMAFIPLSLIIIASYGISYILGTDRILNGTAINRKLSRSAAIFATVSLIAIFSVGLIFNSISLINVTDTLKDSDRIVSDYGSKFTTGNKVILQKPADYLMMYSLKTQGINYTGYEDVLYPDNNIIILVSKSAGQNVDEILNNFYSTHDLLSLGFTDPEILKDYPTATIYESRNRVVADNIIFDLTDPSNENNIEMEKFIFSSEPEIDEFLLDDFNPESLKYVKISVSLQKDTEYLIRFKIKADQLTNKIFIDFFGDNYDNPDQEFNIDPETIKQGSFVEVRKVINSGEFKDGIDTFFRIFTYANGHLQIQDLKIYKVDD